MQTSKLERAYRTFVTCRALVQASRSEQQMLQDICETSVSVLGYRLAWIGLVSDGDSRVRPVAQAGFEAGYLNSIHVTWTEGEFGTGPTGRAIRERRPAVCQDIATDDQYAPWRADALHRGYASSAAFPLTDDAHCIGALNLYATEPDAFNDDELALLRELAIDLQRGMQRHRMHSKLAAMTSQLEQGLRTYAAAAATVALTHDINNLLQVVSGSIALARRTDDDGRRDRALADAQAATSSIAAHSRQILALGRRGTYGAATTEVDQTIRGTVALLARLATNADLDLQLAADGSEAAIAPSDLERILLNLTINANHAMPNGGRLRITTRAQTLTTATPNAAGRLEPGTYLVLSVSDDGGGIPEDVLPKVFEPFFSTKDDGGTGLGLHAVLTLARTIGGGVEIQSQPGVGTQVDVWLPTAPGHGQPTA